MRIVVAFLLLASTAFAQPQIKGDPVTVLEGDPIEIASGIDVPEGRGEWHTWRVTTLEGAAQARGRWYSRHDTYAMWALPGRYEVEHTAIITDWESKSQTGETEYRLVVVTSRGPPVVIVKPDEPSDPLDPIRPPAPGKRLVVVIRESSQIPIPMQVHRARRMLQADGHQVRVIDKDSLTGLDKIPKEYAAALAATSGRDLPYLVIALADGNVARAIPLPGTADEIVAEVAK